MKLTPSEPDVKTLVERIGSGDIDLQPDFQRQEVWSIKKKKKLIDTILRGWSIPPVHLVENEDKLMEVLDGQQRLASIRDFVNNRFSIDGTITPNDERIAALHGKFYKQLDVVTRRHVDQYALRCFRISDYAPEEPSELFYRLNQPTALTAGEQRNALYGPARHQLKELVSYFEAKGNDKATIGFSNVRLAYDDVLARLLFFLEFGSFGAKGTEARVSERFRDSNEFPAGVIDKSRLAIDLFSKARVAAPAYRFNKASVLSWLLFYSRFHERLEPSISFISKFIDASNRQRTSHFVTEAVSVFEDRASLRVTDVSSVVFRDFTLWYVYYFLIGTTLPRTEFVPIISMVEDQLKARDDVSFEFVLSHHLDIELWAGTL